MPNPTADPSELALPPAAAYAVVAQAIAYLRDHARAQPDLAQVAAAVGLSPFYLQRVFSQWAGVSPKRFLQCLTKDYARAQLVQRRDVLSVALDAGLSSPSRLHDLMISAEAMTPGEVQALGCGLTLGWGWGDTPFGPALLAWTPRGVCHLVFGSAGDPARATPTPDTAPPAPAIAAPALWRDGQAQPTPEPDSRAEADLAQRWPNARLQRDDAHAQALLQQIFARTPTPGRLHLVLRGTNFQIQVWQALLRTARGDLLSYQQLGQQAGCPRAARAVGSALAANALGVLIPCHRVILGDGDVGHYRWGRTRKLALLGWEAVCTSCRGVSHEPERRSRLG